MRLSSRFSEERGSASLEFLALGMLLLLPLVYLVIAVATLQAAAFAVEAGARQAVRVFVLAPDRPTAEASARRALDFALADHGVRSGASLEISCTREPCLTRQGLVTISVDVTVPLPLVPPVIVGEFPLAVPLHATATAQVSRFWGTR